MRKQTILSGVLLLGLLSGTVLADKATGEAKIDDKARKVWDRSIEVQFGDVAKKRNIKTIRMRGEMAMPAQGMTAKMEMIQAQNKASMTIEIPNLGKMQEGFTGKHAWSFSELQGPALKTDAEAAQSRQQADIYNTIDWEKYYSAIKHVGEESIDNYEGEKRDVDVLELVSKDGERTSKAYFDKETGRNIRTDAEIVIQGGMTVPNKVVMTDFRTVGGMLVPHKIKSTVGPMEQIVTFQKITVNEDVPASAFAVPEEVQALIAEADKSDDKE